MYTIFDYQIDSRNAINDIVSRGKTPIIVGGSGLYIRAALYDYKLDFENKKNDYSKCCRYIDRKGYVGFIQCSLL